MVDCSAEGKTSSGSKIREEERRVLYEHYKSKEHDIVTGIVQRQLGNNISINLGKADALLMENEQIRGEYFRPSDRIKLYVLEVKDTTKGPRIVVSRTHPELVKDFLKQKLQKFKTEQLKLNL